MRSSNIFDPLIIRSHTIPNRIVISPMCQYSAIDGNITDWHIGHYLQMAISGAGMIVLESTSVSKEGRITLGDIGLYSEKNESNLRRLILACKEHSNVPIAIQLSHAGRKGSISYPWMNSEPLSDKQNGWVTYAPSGIPRTKSSNVPLELSVQQINSIKTDFIKSAIRADKAGLDCVELHIAHGYLLHQFFSPISNKRVDEYGGSLKKRMRIIIEIAEGIKKVWPTNKLIGARVTAQDWLENGLSIEDCIQLVKELKNIGVDYVCVSSGGILPITNLKSGPNFQVGYAMEVKKKTGIITRAVGQIRNYKDAQSIIESGDSDLVAIGRGYLNDPRWIWKASRHFGKQIDVPSQYERGYW
jgi:2,4-dienoyl-CoA reductase-like NADH-dependent reductase (Old Yellow Enzyme family)